MTIQSLNLLPAAPEIFVLVMVCTILVVDLFLDEAHRHWSYVLTLLTLALAAVITLVGGGPEPRHAFNGMFVEDQMARVLKAFICISVAAMLVYARACRDRGLFRGEFFTPVYSRRWA
jgi:NADH-quinone oxidoreductase subunit N